jgi:Family of unknown function (DUF6111)
MIRVLALRALLFALPFALYGLYLLMLRARPGLEPRPTPWTMLFIAGMALVAASFIYLGLTEGETTSGVYVPPHVVNGAIVPGHVEKKP